MLVSQAFTRVEPAYRTFWRRAAAGIFDWCVTVELLRWIGEKLELSTPESQVAWSIGVAAVLMGYSIVGHKVWGQTVGKWIFGVRVIDLRGGGLAWWQAIARDAVPNALLIGEMALSFGPLLNGLPDPLDENVALDLLFRMSDLSWYALEMSTMFLNERRRAIHDLIARTVVVRTAPLGRKTKEEESSEEPAGNEKAV